MQWWHRPCWSDILFLLMQLISRWASDLLSTSVLLKVQVWESLICFGLIHELFGKCALVSQQGCCFGYCVDLWAGWLLCFGVMAATPLSWSMAIFKLTWMVVYWLQVNEIVIYCYLLIVIIFEQWNIHPVTVLCNTFTFIWLYISSICTFS